MDFQDRGETDPELSQGQESEIQPGTGTNTLPAGQDVVTLPPGASLDDIVVEGRDLVIQLADGSRLVIPDGAVFVPQIVIDGVTVPPFNIAQLLTGNEPQPAAGTLQSSGGNFAEDEGAIQDAFNLGDLLPFTDFGFPQNPDDEIIPDLVDRDPDVVIRTPNNPVGAQNATASVDEDGLPARGNEPEGTNAPSPSETTTGTIVFSAPDGLASVTIEGIAVTSVGQTIATRFGTLTITSIDLVAGTIGYSYSLGDNTLGAGNAEVLRVVVTETDGDQATATLTIAITDDAPIAADDLGQVPAGSHALITGDVLVNDVPGADGYAIEGAVLEFGNGESTVAPGTALQGQYGVLTLNAGGTYSYARDGNTPGGVEESFTYTIVDQDGSTSTATLVVEIGDADDVFTGVPREGDGTVVNEGGLPARGDEPAGTGEISDADGTNDSDPSERTSSTVTFNSPDGVASLTINGVAINGAELPLSIVVDGGTLVITNYTYNPLTGDGSFDYQFTLNDNTQGDTSFSFELVLTDLDGDRAEDTLVITVVDDMPSALDDNGAVAAGEYGPIGGNVVTNDTPGADGVSVTSYSGTGGSGTTGTTVQGTYGTLTIAADGTFTYTRDPGTPGGVSDTFSYTITDGDGDEASANLIIAIANSRTSLDLPDEGEGGTSVDEAGLAGPPAGSDAASLSEQTTGTFTYTAPDGPAVVTIDGVAVAAVGQLFSGDFGTLRIDSIADGSITYTYTLTINTIGDATSDNFVVRVTDQDGDFSEGTLGIDIIDDVPTANADTNSVTEGDSATGNVLTDNADVFGADGAEAAGGVVGVRAAGGDTTTDAAGSVGVSIAGLYGTLTLNADGSYTYASTANAITGDEIDVFVYTIEDGDGDLSTTTLTIDVADVTLAPDNDTVSVDEAALDTVGSNPASNGETATGQLAVTGAVSYVLDSGTDTYGALTLNADGSYSYTLATPFDTSPDADNGTNTELGAETYNYTATDANGNTVTGTITIDIIDDVPTANADTNSVTEGDSATGNVLTDNADVFGADGAEAAGGVVGVRAAGGDTTTDAAGSVGVSIAGLYGTLTLNADGSYTYASTANAITGDEIDVFVYTIEDGDGDLSTTTLTIDVADVTLAPDNDTVSVDEAALDTVGSNPASNGETATGQLAVTGAVSYVLDSGTDTYGALTLNADGSYSYTLATPFDTSPDADNGTNTELGAETYNYTATDANGNTVTGTITIDIIDDVPTANADTNSVTEGDSATGNVLTDNADVFGADGAEAAGGVVGVRAAGGDTTTDAAGSVGVSIAGLYGTLTLNADGSYTYASTANAITGDEIDVFVYTIEDGDGDLSTTTLTIDVADVTLAPDNDTVSVDEAALDTVGSNPASNGETATGQLAVTGAVSYVLDSGTDTYGALTLNADGSYSYTLATPFDTSPDADNGTNTELGAETYNYTATDANGNTVTGTITIDIIDDVPTANADTNSVTEGDSATGNVLTDNADVFGADGAEAAGGVVGVRAAGGDTTTDAAGSVGVSIAGLYGTLTLNADGSYTYASTANAITGDEIDVFVYTIEDGDGDLSTTTLTIDVANVGLTADNRTESVNEAALDGLGSNPTSNGETATGQLAVTGAVSYVLDSGTDTYGALTLNADGSYSYTLATPFDTSPDADNGTNTELGAETYNYTATDANGNTVTGTITIDIIDDGPTIDVTQAGAGGVVLTTRDANTDGAPTDTDTASSGAGFGGVFGLTSTSGADGAAAPSLSYALSLVSGVPQGAPSGLTIGGVAINLYNVGGVIVGSTALTAPASATDASVVFSIAVAADGDVTLSQLQQIDHPIADDPSATEAPFNDDIISLADGLVQLTASSTITDGDGDTATDSETVDLGGNISFVDDGPTIDVTQAGAGGVVLTTRDANTDGAPTDTDTASSGAGFGGVFGLTSTSGADGAAAPSLSYALSLVSGVPQGAPSGLTIGGVAINLYNVGGVIVGSTALTAPASATDASVVFSIAVAADGDVTLSQLQQIDHPIADDPSATEAPFNDDIISLADGLVQLTASSTITDGDGDTATDSETVDLGGNISFVDDGPTIDVTQAGAGGVVLTTRDANTDGAPTDTDTASSGAGFGGVFGLTSTSGADGAAAPSLSYALSLVSGVPQGAPSGLTIGGVAINLYNVGGVIVGSTALTAPASATDASVVFSIAVAADGDVTLSQLQQIDHPIADDPSATEAPFNDDIISLADGLVQLTASSTITDGDGDTATDSETVDLGGNISFVDDGPTIDVTQAGAGGVVLTTRDANTDGAPTDTDTASSGAGFGGVFGLTSTSGADGAAAPSLSYALSLVSGVPQGAPSGLTIGGVAINLYNVGGVIVGSTALTAPASATDASVVFSIAVAADGDVTLSQLQQIDHPIADDPSATEAPFNDDIISLADGLVQLTASSTITDGDGDTATDSETVDLGGNISFVDDGPTIDVTQAGAGGVVLTTRDANTDGAPTDTDTASSGAGFGGVFGLTSTSGADGAAAPSLSYALSLVSGVPQGAPSGLTIGGVAINLYNVGGVIVGSTALTAPASATDASVVFSIAVAADGDVTLSQLQQIDHPIADDPSATEAPFNDDIISLADGLVQLTASSTITDGDGDTATDSETVDLGGNISFVDDGPTIDVTQAGAGGVVLTTRDANTDGAPTDTDTASSGAGFGGVFGLTSTSGADGAAAPSLSYALSLVSGVPQGAPSGLTIGGVAINLYNVGGVIVGSTALTAPASATDASVVFSIAVAADGDVTLSQLQQIDHPIADDPSATEAPFNDDIISLADGLVQLTASSTITDGDGDTATDSETVDLGGNISFVDDGPTIDVTQAGAGGVVLTTRDANTDGAPTDTDTASSGAGFGGVFGLTSTSGADGAAAPSLSYALSLVSGVPQGAPSGLTIGGVAINLYNVGGVIVGSTALTAPASATDASVVFSIAVAADGDVTLSQLQQIDHPIADDPSATEAPFNDDIISLADGLVQLTASSTITDGDGDTATDSETVDLGGNISFVDDGPTIISVTTPLQITNSGTVSNTGDFVFSTGADGPGVGNDAIKSVTFSATVNGNPVASPTITPISEDGNAAVYNISFTYATGSGTTTTETGVVTFNKAAGTYTVDLDDPIQGFSIPSTSGGTLFQGYQMNSASTDNSQPAVAVTQIANNLFVQFTSVAEPRSGGGADNLFTINYGQATTPPNDGAGLTFTNGELFSQAASWVSTSNAANGVGGDTIQGGEVLDFNLYSSNPTGFVGTIPTASSDTMFIKLDGIGSSEDFILILKLLDTVTGEYTTKALMVQNSDIQKGPGSGPGIFSGVSLDNNDGLIIIEANDYNSAGENFVIVGAQIAGSDEGITGTAINFNNALGAGGASTGTQTFSTDVHDGPMKISDIGFVSQSTTDQAAQLIFNVTVQDGDGDTAQQTLVVNIGAIPLALTSSSQSIQSFSTSTMLLGDPLTDPNATNDNGSGSGTGGLSSIQFQSALRIGTRMSEISAVAALSGAILLNEQIVSGPAPASFATDAPFGMISVLPTGIGTKFSPEQSGLNSFDPSSLLTLSVAGPEASDLANLLGAESGLSEGRWSIQSLQAEPDQFEHLSVIEPQGDAAPAMALPTSSGIDASMEALLMLDPAQDLASLDGLRMADAVDAVLSEIAVGAQLDQVLDLFEGQSPVSDYLVIRSGGPDVGILDHHFEAGTAIFDAAQLDTDQAEAAIAATAQA